MSDDNKLPTVNRKFVKQTWDSKKFSRLKSMDCFPEVYDLLVQGYQPSRVAAVIQNQHGEYRDIRMESLANLLRDFYDDEIPSSEKVAHQLPAKFDETIRDFEESVDVLKEYRDLYTIQKDRIDMAWEKEQATGQLMKNTGREIKIAAELLDRIQKTQDTKGMSPARLEALSQSAGMALKASAVNGIDGRPLMSPSKRNQIFEFLGMLRSTDPRIVEATIISGEEVEEDSEES